jgi:hypothetical protein
MKASVHLKNFSSEKIFIQSNKMEIIQSQFLHRPVAEEAQSDEN